MLSQINNNADDNEHITQALLFSCTTYNLVASGTDLLNRMYLYVQEGLKGLVFWIITQSRVKLWLLRHENFIVPIVLYFNRFW